MNIKIGEREYKTMDMLGKASELKKAGTVVLHLYDCVEDDLNYLKSFPEIDKMVCMKRHYTWVFLNCEIQTLHFAPARWSYNHEHKDLIVTFKFKDIVGSHSDELVKGKIRDKKLKELLK
jgi:hypothetical protein